MTPPRLQQNRRSMMQAPPCICGIQMRAISAGTLELCRDLGISFLDGPAAVEEADDVEMRRQLNLFLFIHGYADAEKMLELVYLPEDEFRRHFIRFALNLDLGEAMHGVRDWLKTTNQRIDAASVKIEPKPEPETGEAGPEPPPNS